MELWIKASREQNPYKQASTASFREVIAMLILLHNPKRELKKFE
jgi:hypothetical protein